MITQRQLFFDHLAQTTDFPMAIEVSHAEGVYVHGPNGERYLDLISGIGVSSVGHRHPKILAAIQEQLDKYLHVMVYGEFIQTPQVALATALSKTLPDPLDTVYLVNSGSEAVEGALKLAKRYTGRFELISCHNAYHGSTHGALAVSGSEEFKQAYRPLPPGIRHINYGELADIEQITTQTAAIIIETVQGEAGVQQASKAYWQALRQRCTETGALLILDEIQAGFGRTGTFWAFEQYDIVPDIIVSAKGMGGGMPIGAFTAAHEVMKVFRNNPLLGHITTFGGHPVSAAASLATLQLIQEERLYEQVPAKAALFRELLQHDAILELRQAGFMMALEFGSFELLTQIIEEAVRRGIISDWFLYCDTSMRIAPPLTITETEIREACQLVLESVDAVLEARQ